MKDDKLEKQFDEYFDNVKTPDNITADAKRYVKRKSAVTPRFVKFASIAASFVLVLAISLTVILTTRQEVPAAPDNSANGGASVPDGSADAPGASGDDSVNSSDGTWHFVSYADSDLKVKQTEVYGITKLNNSLKFIRNLAYSGAAVTDCSAGYMNTGGLAIVKADVSLIDGLSRHEAKVFVEFTDADTVYSPLTNYYRGTKGTYNGVTYYLTRETAENGEPLNKLQFTYGGVKYYFSVSSSDENSYMKYLKLIIK